MSFTRKDMPSMEPLEARAMMAAPTASVVNMWAEPLRLVMVVDWTNANQFTLGNDDFQMAKVGGAAIPAQMMTQPTLVGGKLRTTYLFNAYDNAWGVTDTGTYEWTSPTGNVLSPQDDPIADPMVHSRGLWWGTPKARLISQTLRNDGTNQDWLIVIQYDTLNGLDTSTIGANDLQASQSRPLNVQSIVPMSATSTRVVYQLKAPGGAWSFANNGFYQFFINFDSVKDLGARAVPSHWFPQAYSLWFAQPRAQVLGTQVGENDWIIPVRYTARPGQSINPASIVVGEIPVYVTGPGGWTKDATLSQLVHGTDGSYTAYYRIEAKGGAWDFTDNGSYVLKQRGGRVADTAGQFVSAFNIQTYSLWFTSPTAEIVTPSNPGFDRWDLNIRFRDDVQINRSTITANSIRVLGPDGLELAFSLISISGANPGAVNTALFRAFSVGDIFENGEYRVFLNRDGVRDSGGRIAGEVLLGTFNVNF